MSNHPKHKKDAQNDALGLAQADLTERVADAMRAVSRAYVMALIQALEKEGYDGLTPASISLLAKLPEQGVQTVVLANQTGRSKQATGKLVAELEANGYVERIPDPTDRRGRLVRLTKQGDAALANGVGIKEALSAHAVEALGPDALARLYADLASLEAVFADQVSGKKHNEMAS